MSNDSFGLAIKQIRKDWSFPHATVMLWSKNKLLPIGYQILLHKAVNDNEAKP